MNEHTPTPWFKNRKLEIGPRPRTDDQSDGMLHPVADVFGDNGEADAAFIVKAVNSHVALVKALQFIADGYDNQDVNHVDFRVKAYQVAIEVLELVGSPGFGEKS